MENWAKRFKDYSTSLDSVEVSSAKQRREMPQYRKQPPVKMRSLSNYGKTKITDRILGSILDEFGVEPVLEEKYEDCEEEDHKIHKFKLFLDKKEDLMFRNDNGKHWGKTRSKSTEMVLPKVVELREEDNPVKAKKRKFSTRRSNKWMTDKTEKMFEWSNHKQSDSKSLFNAESNVTIEEEERSSDEESDKDTISCFSAPNPIKNKMVDEIDCIERENYREINEIIEEMSENEQEDADTNKTTRALKQKRRQLKSLLRSLNKSDMVCLDLLPNPKYSFVLKDDKDLEIIPENNN